MQKIMQVTWVGIVVNLGLSGLKFWVGILGGSQAVVADAVHSLSDLTTDFAIIFGARYWSAPADEKHPYGHLRIETLVTAFIGLLLMGSAFGITYHAIRNLLQGTPGQPAWIALIGAAGSVLIKELLYRWTINVGQRVKSSAVIANAWHHRSDAISSLPAAIAVALAALNPRLAFIDNLGAFIVSIFILKVGWNITKSALRALSDESAPQKDLDQIYALAREVAGVESVHAVRTRNLGARLHVDLHIEVDGNLTVRRGHDISEDVKRQLIENGPDVIDVVVHLEPLESLTV